MTEHVEQTHEQRLAEAKIYEEREKRRREKQLQKPASYEEAQAAAEKLKKGERFIIRGDKVLKIKDGYSSYVGKVKQQKALIKKYNIKPEL
jgi:hypothetical protein